MFHVALTKLFPVLFLLFQDYRTAGQPHFKQHKRFNDTIHMTAMYSPSISDNLAGEGTDNGTSP